MTSDGGLAPTARLRFVTRGGDVVQGPTTSAGPTASVVPRRILQQWWGPNVPSYMVDANVGEWRDVPVEGAP